MSWNQNGYMNIYIWGQYLFSRMYKSIFYYFYIHLLLHTVAMQNLTQSRELWRLSDAFSCVQNKNNGAPKLQSLYCISHCLLHRDSQRRIQQTSYSSVYLVWIANVIVEYCVPLYEHTYHLFFWGQVLRSLLVCLFDVCCFLINHWAGFYSYTFIFLKILRHERMMRIFFPTMVLSCNLYHSRAHKYIMYNHVIHKLCI